MSFVAILIIYLLDNLLNQGFRNVIAWILHEKTVVVDDIDELVGKYFEETDLVFFDFVSSIGFVLGDYKVVDSDDELYIQDDFEDLG